MHQEEFDAEVEETMKRNMYVDDMMKSTSTTEKAVSLASQLRRLLEKGDFHLTKWYSNDREVLATISESERAKSVVNLELERLPTDCSWPQVEYRRGQVCMGGLGEDIAACEPETNDTQRDCVSCLFHL